MTSNTPPGWYQGEGDPPGSVRWWDGEVWANEFVMQEPGAAAGGVAGSPQGAAARLSRPYASWGQRVGATIVDWLIGIAIGIVVLIVAGILGSIASGLGTIASLLGNLVSLAWSFYVVMWLQGTHGQSPGKRIMGLQTVDASTGEYIGGGKAIGRGILAFINWLPLFLGILWPLWDSKRQTFTDKIFSAVVVETDRPKDLLPIFPDGKPF